MVDTGEMIVTAAMIEEMIVGMIVEMIDVTTEGIIGITATETTEMRGRTVNIEIIEIIGITVTTGKVAIGKTGGREAAGRRGRKEGRGVVTGAPHSLNPRNNS